MNDLATLLKPELLQSIAGLELLAKIVSEELSAGLHKSVQSGFGQEFSQYRSYEVGDDPRNLDWKMFARSDRYFVRLAEIENRVNLRFMLDASASMQHTWQQIEKLDVARVLIAALAWLSQKYNDSLSLESFNSVKHSLLSSGSGSQHFRRLLHRLLQVQAEGIWWDSAANKVEKAEREMVLIFSDLHQNAEEILQSIQGFKTLRNEVMVFHLLAPDELQPETETQTLQDLETQATITVGGKAWAQEMAALRQQEIRNWKEQLESREISYEWVDISQNPANVIDAFLKKRQRLV